MSLNRASGNYVPLKDEGGRFVYKEVESRDSKVFTHYQLARVSAPLATLNNPNPPNHHNNHNNHSNNNNNNSNNNNTLHRRNTEQHNNSPTRNNNDDKSNEQDVNHMAHDIRKNQLQQVYRMYDTERIDALCAADSKVFNVPYVKKIGETRALLDDEFPPMLRGYISASFYTEIISKLNSIQRAIYDYSQVDAEFMALVVASFILVVPFFALIGKAFQAEVNQSERVEEAKKYIDGINNYSRNVKWTIARGSKVATQQFFASFHVSVELLPNKFYRTTKLGVKHF